MSNKTFYLLLVVGFVGLLVYMGVHNRNQPGANPSFNPHAGASQVAGGRTLPGAANLNSLNLTKLGGGTISLAEYQGKKPVVVDFWASWCPNCRRDMPHLNSFYEKYKDRVEVIAINLQENESTVANFIADRRFSFPVALDPGAQASSAFGIQYTNTHILIDKNGQIVRFVPGDIREEDFISLIQ